MPPRRGRNNHFNVNNHNIAQRDAARNQLRGIRGEINQLELDIAAATRELHTKRTRLGRLHARITAMNMNIQQAEAVAPGGPRNGITPEVALQRRIRKRRREPSHLLDGNSHKIDLPDRSAKRRKEETKKHATITHGASDVDQRPMFEGLWATTMTYTPAAYLTPMVKSSKKMMKQVIPMVNLNTVRDYNAGDVS